MNGNKHQHEIHFFFSRYAFAYFITGCNLKLYPIKTLLLYKLFNFLYFSKTGFSIKIFLFLKFLK